MIKEPIFTGNTEKDMQFIKDSISALVRYVNSLDRNYINTGEAVGIDDVFEKVANIEKRNVAQLKTVKSTMETINNGYSTYGNDAVTRKSMHNSLDDIIDMLSTLISES